MKICIFSSYEWILKANNYGSILQYFALQTFLKKEGHEPYWLRYKHERSKWFMFVIKTLLRRKFKYTVITNKNMKGFQSFMDTYLNVSEKEYFNYSMLRKNAPKADAYISGSDQVFGGLSAERYLCFAPKDKPKIAYAASFGSSKDGFLQKLLYRWRLKNLDTISVRESSAVLLCSNLGRPDAINVCDPSLLITKQEYLEVLGLDIKEQSENYLYGYFVNPLVGLDEIHLDKLKQYTESNGLFLKMTAIQGAESIIPFEYQINPNPKEWLELIANAKFVVTNSFHGVVFSIVMRKPFIVIPQKGGVSAQNVRYYDLLDKLGLANRIYTGGDFVKAMTSKIDWSKSELEISNFISFSKSFLLESLLK